MRLDHHGMQIELHQAQDAWLWVVFDEEGEQVSTGRKPHERAALSAARRSADWRHGVVETGVRYLTSVARSRSRSRSRSKRV
jgi:hypothetical protein